MDGSGNVYITDGYNRILKETPVAGGCCREPVPTGDCCFPLGLAVDGSGNLYIFNSSRQLDISGDVFGGQLHGGHDDNQRRKSPRDRGGWERQCLYRRFRQQPCIEGDAIGGRLRESIVSTSGLNSPYGVTVDGSGNVYISDTGNSRVLKEDLWIRRA